MTAPSLSEAEIVLSIGERPLSELGRTRVARFCPRCSASEPVSSVGSGHRDLAGLREAYHGQPSVELAVGIREQIRWPADFYIRAGRKGKMSLIWA